MAGDVVEAFQALSRPSDGNDVRGDGMVAGDQFTDTFTDALLAVHGDLHDPAFSCAGEHARDRRPGEPGFPGDFHH